MRRRVSFLHRLTGGMLAVALATPALAQSLEWDANGVAPLGGAGTWDLASLRWYDGTAYRAWNNLALSDAVFGGTAGTVTLAAPITAHNLTFTVTGYTITGSTLELGGVDPTVAVNTGTATLNSIILGAAGLTKSGTGTLVLGASNSYSGTTTISAGTLQVGSGGTAGSLGSGDVINNGVLAFSRSNAFEVANQISGTGNVTKAGAGTMTLTANNTYTGTTSVTAGTLQIGNGGTSGSLGGGAVTLASGAILAINRSDAVTIANVIGGTGGQLRQVGSGTTTLTGTNTYTGTTTISAGTLQIGNGGTTGAIGAGAIVNNGTLAINRNNAVAMANVISGTGTLRHNGVGTTTLSGTSTFTGAVELDAGVLAISNLQNGGVSSNIGASSNAAANLRFDGGTLRYTGAARTTDRNFLIEDGGATLDGSGTAALTWNGTASYDVAGEARSLTLTGTRAGNIFGGALTNNGAGELSLTKAGTGSWLLTGNNSYSGTTTISAGTLQVGNAGTTGTLGSGNVINNGNLTLSRSDALTLANQISGTGSVTKAGAGTTTLTANNSYTGITTISLGTLQIGNGGTTGTLGTGGVTNNAALAINRSDDYAIGQVISGTGTLRQEGSGTTTLTGANTYSGATTISAGTLRVGNGGTTGAVGAGAIVNNSTLAINRSNALTMANVISGSGTLRHEGAGTTTLSGTSTFTGAVELDGGVLAIANLQNGGVSSNIGASSSAASNLRFDGGTLRYTGAARATDRNFLIEDGGATLDGSGTGVLTWNGTASYDLANASRSLTLTGTANGNIFAGTLSDNGTGALSLTKSGTSRWVLSANNSYSGTTTISAGTLQVGNGGTTGTLGSGAVIDNGALIFARSDALAVGNAISGTGSVSQTGAGTTTLTGNNSYAGTTTISAGTLQVGAGGVTGSLGLGAVTNNAILAINRSDALTLSNAISGTGQLRQIGAGTTTLTGANSYSGLTTISAGTLQVGAAGTSGSLGTGNVTNNATLAINRSNALTVANVIGGTGVLRQEGAGVTTLSGTNTFTGAVEINGGTLAISNLQNGGLSSNLGASSSAAANLSFDGGTLRYTGAARSTDRNFLIEDGGATIESNGTGALTWAGTASYDVANDARSLTLTGTRAGNLFTGLLSDNGTGALSLTKSGASSWILTANNTHSGTTTINAGTLQVGNSGTTGTLGTGAVVNNGTLAISRSNTIDITNAISGTGSVTKASTGTTILSGDNSYAGTTTISAGTLQVGSGGTTGTLGTGNVANAGTLAINRSNAYTIAQSISGAGALRQIGSGTTTLAGANTYTGTTTITAGTLQVGNGGSSGALGTGAVANGGILAINRGDTYAIGQVVSGAGQLRQVGSGTTVLTGTNTYTGATTISAGTLQLGNGGTTGSIGAGAITNNATLAINRSNALTLTNLIGGAGTLRQSGAGVTTLSGANTFTGAVELDAGVLAIGNLQNGGINSNLGASSNAASNLRFDGGTLRYTGAAATTDRNFLIEDGGATLEASGTAALTWNGTALFDVADEARSLTLSGTRTGNVFGGVLTDNGASELALVKSDTGSWLFTGNNSYSGTTTISAGTLQVGNNGATGTLGSGDVINNSSLIFARTGVLDVAGAISGTGTVTQSASGTTRLTGQNTYAGTTTVSAGTLQIGDGGTTGTLGAGNVVNNATLTFQRSDALNVANSIAGTGTINQSGTGTTQLAGTVSANATNVNSGTLQVSGSLTTSALALGATLDVQGTVAAAGATPVTITGTASDGRILVGSAGTLRASGDLGGGSDTLDLAGTLITGAGTLTLGNDDDTLIWRDGANVSGTISGGAGFNTLNVDIASASSLPSVQSFQDLEKNGTGTLSITGAVTGLDSVRVNTGSLAVTGSVSDVTNASVANGATLNVTGSLAGSSSSDSWTVTGTVSGSGSFDLGAGDDTLMLNDGAVLLTAISAGSQTVADTLILNNSTAFTLADSTTSGFEQLVKTNAGMASLTGAQAFTAGTVISQGTLEVTGSLATPSIAIEHTGILDVRGSVAPTVLAGDAGASTILIRSGALLTANGALGDGADVLDVAGTLDTALGILDLGDGDDTLTIHDDTRIIGTVAAGAGVNILNTHITTVADLGATTGFQSLVKSGTGTLNVNGPATSIFGAVAVSAGTLNVASTATIDPVSTVIAAGATLHVDGSYLGTTADDTMDVSGTVSGAGVIDLGDGNDELTLNDGATLSARISGGAGSSDAVVISTSGTMSLDSSALSGFEILGKRNSGSLELTDAQTWSAIAVDGGSLVASNPLNVGSLSLGDDTGLIVSGSAQSSLLSGSAGANRIVVSQGAVLAASGSLGAGADVLDIAGTLDAGLLDLGDGDDQLTIHNGSRIVGTVNGGAGSNAFNVNVTSGAELGAVSGFESLVMAGSGTLSFTGPDASSFTTVRASAGTIDVATGASIIGARTTIIAPNATMNISGSYAGSSGADSLVVAGALTGPGRVNLAEGNDLVILRDGATLAATIDAGEAQSLGDTLLADMTRDYELDTTRVLGFENLSKRGTNVLTLPGDAAFGNSVRIDSGTLISSGTLTAGQVGVAAGATLAATGSIVGNVSNAGLLTMGAAPFSTLTVRGDYVGADGTIDLRVELGDSDSSSDKLAIDGGVASGTTRVRVINEGGLGARTTGSGIQVVETSNGATTTSDAFHLDAPVVAGAYRYDLFHGAAEDADPQGWYLRSLAPIRDVATLATSLLPVAHNYGLALVSTLQDRDGADLQSDCDGNAARGCQWGRVWHRSGERDGGIGGTDFDYEVTGLQMGTDIHIDSTRDRADRAGAYINIGSLGADPRTDEGLGVGTVEGRAYSLATYWTHRDPKRWYLDSTLAATYMSELQLEPQDDTRLSTDAWSIAGSIEGGARFSFGSRFAVGPQLQILGQHLKVSDAETLGAIMEFEDADTVIGRAGLSFDGMLSRQWSLWLRANYWEELSGDAQTSIGTVGGVATLFQSSFEDRWLEIAAGLAARFSERASLHLSISNSQGLGDSESSALQGNLGLRLQW